MKKKLLLILAAACCLAAGRAQVGAQYQSVFGDSVARWADTYIESSHLNAASEAYEVYTNDTIVINGKVYKKWHQWELAGGDVYIGHERSQFAFRESDDHSKLYFKVLEHDGTYDTSAELLIMDLNLEVGDTMATEGWWEVFHKRPEIVIDSIYYENGNKILLTSVVINTNPDHPRNDTLMFIEGVGPSFGLLYATAPISPYVPSMVLLCYHRDDVLEHTGSILSYYWGGIFDFFNEKCWLAWSVGRIGSTPQSGVALSPNPTSGMLKITYPDMPEGTATVISPIGEPLCTAPVQDGAVQLDISAFPPGVYVVNIVSGTASIAQKVIKL